MKEPTVEQLEARQFFAAPCRTTLLRVVDLALQAFEEWEERWVNACAALHAIGLKYSDEELEVAFSERQNERSAS